MDINSHGYVIVGRKGCGSCIVAKDMLDRVGKSYQYIDMSDLSAQQRATLIDQSRKVGNMGLPIILYNGDAVTMNAVINELGE